MKNDKLKVYAVLVRKTEVNTQTVRLQAFDTLDAKRRIRDLLKTGGWNAVFGGSKGTPEVFECTVCESWLSDKEPTLDQARCDNCGHVQDSLVQGGGKKPLAIFPDIPDLLKRIDPGGEVPCAECPQCGSLMYLLKEKKDASVQ